MNWVILLVAGAVTVGLLWALGVSRRLWTIAGAALMLAAAGFAAQGPRHVPGKPVAADVTPIVIEPGMVAFREAVFALSRADSLALASADARLRDGDARAAIEGLRADLAARPRDAALWAGLGYAFALHDRAMSPAAKFAFRRAVLLAPETPGPLFFLGLAYVDSGNLAAARPAWRFALAVTPPGAPYRADIAERVVLLDRILKAAAGHATKP